MQGIRLLVKMAKSMIRFIYKIMYRLVSVDEKMVVFTSFHGRGYSDSPRAIYEQMKKDERFKDYRFVWFVKNQKRKNYILKGQKLLNTIVFHISFICQKQNIGYLMG